MGETGAGALLSRLACPRQHCFKRLTTTAGGYHTWDPDLINVDAVSQTGHGVYVALLDTGMVPNWRDYFPEARVATALGTGFDQPVTFRGSKDNQCGLDVEVGQLQQTTTWAAPRWRHRTSPRLPRS